MLIITTANQGMNLPSISVALLLLCFLTISSSSSSNQSDFAGDVSLNRGSVGASAADSVPQKTARISRSQFSYEFQLNPGQKIIRFHFNPTEYRGFKGLKDLSTVEAVCFTLLSNFSTSLTADSLGVNTFSKEFSSIVPEKQKLNIVFCARSLDKYAYVNALSVPACISYFLGGDIGLRGVGKNSLVYVDNSTALEIVHWISIKQDLVSSAYDSTDVFAMWLNQRVDNITRKIPIGMRFRMRNHLIKNRSVRKSYDYSMLTEFKGLDLGINMLSNKVSCPDSNLTALNLHNLVEESPSKTFRTMFLILGCRNAITTIAIAAICLVNIIVHQLRVSWEASSSEEENKPSAGADRVCRRFTLAEIKLASRNFNEELVIGKGGFGKVYKGFIDEGQKTVAIKKLNPNSRQGAYEFLTEIETLSEILHINVVSLIGYCNEHREMIIVYEYMACGTLADHLYKLPRDNSEFSCLTWKQRLNICIGVARGLEYLHTGRGIIHRDLKSSNILLDENFVAKVSDFGLAKPEDRTKLQSHVSTKVKGTFGYIDPYYVTTSKLRRKSDTYSFGVVLLEVLCGRRAVDSEVLEDEPILTKWAQDKISKGEVDHVVAASIREEISPNCLNIFVGIAGRCLDDEPKNRPTMSEVVLHLEFALEQQVSNQSNVLNEIALVSDGIRLSSSNDGIHLLSTKQTTRDLRLPLDAKTSGKVVVDAELTSGRKQWTKFTTIKPLRFRPWQAFWKRVKPSKKHKWSFADLDDIACLDNWQYDFSRIRAATCDFSETNKLGQGGLGSVYRGKLLNGQEIAVKRLTTSLIQGNVEFKNKLLLLASLEHMNLVRLLGFCLEGNERFLIYEFVENSGLDRFIFDPIKRSYLDWNQLYKIIKGIAMGLVYLHQDSRLRIFHCNLKASNVLLDGDLNPKLADFGIAGLLEADKTQGATSRVAGTYGYMAPECAVNGHFSVETDVFSFGVIVLEILRGQRRNYSQNGERVDLLNLAWKSWNEGTSANVIDPSLRARTRSLDDVLRCFRIGLLCVQKNPSSRPTMASVALMLNPSTSFLPIPSKPAIFMPNAHVYEALTSQVCGYRQAEASQNGLSITELSPR